MTRTKIVTLCGSCSCGCPEVFVDQVAAPDQRIVITDDFGQAIQMSLDQFSDLIEKARSGELGRLVVQALPTPA